MNHQRSSMEPSLASHKFSSEVYRRQLALLQLYQNDPEAALITDSSKVVGTDLHDPFRTSVSVNEKIKVPFNVGVHEAVGGDHDFPNPSDLQCAALAACLESTIRMISNRLGIELSETRIKVTAVIDVRGTMMIDRQVPAGFQSMHIGVILVASNSNDKVLHTLMGAAKHSCIDYQTIKQGTPITLNVDFKNNTNKN